MINPQYLGSIRFSNNIARYSLGVLLVEQYGKVGAGGDCFRWGATTEQNGMQYFIKKWCRLDQALNLSIQLH